MRGEKLRSTSVDYVTHWVRQPERRFLGPFAICSLAKIYVGTSLNIDLIQYWHRRDRGAGQYRIKRNVVPGYLLNGKGCIKTTLQPRSPQPPHHAEPFTSLYLTTSRTLQLEQAPAASSGIPDVLDLVYSASNLHPKRHFSFGSWFGVQMRALCDICNESEGSSFTGFAVSYLRP